MSRSVRVLLLFFVPKSSCSVHAHFHRTALFQFLHLSVLLPPGTKPYRGTSTFVTLSNDRRKNTEALRDLSLFKYYLFEIFWAVFQFGR